MPFSITALGEILIDFTPAGVSPTGSRLFEQNPGGAPANVLACMSRLGHKTAFIGKIGDDMHGAFLRETLRRSGIDDHGLITDPDTFTTLAFVALAADGARTFSFARKPGADARLTPEEVDESRIRDSRIFHFGSISLSAEPARTATLHALQIAWTAGCIVSYDPNYRAPLWESEAAAIREMRAALPFADVVKISDEETALLTGESDPVAAARVLIAGGAKLVAVTLGAHGALVATSVGETHVPGFAAHAVDSTGAGDSFFGGFLHCLLQSQKAPAEVTLSEAADFARFGCAVASLCVERRGAIPAMPDPAEVFRRLNG